MSIIVHNSGSKTVTIECDFCKETQERFISQAKSKNFFCKKECAKAFYKLQDEKSRHKVCVNCQKNFYDETKRKVGKTCSKECGFEHGVKVRHKNNSYKHSPEHNEKISLSCKITLNLPEQRLKNSQNRIESYKNDPTLMPRIVESRKNNGKPHWTQTEEGKLSISKQAKGRKISDEGRRNMSIGAQKRIRTKRETHHTSARGGKREDLGMYFRSNWEANFARILNLEGLKWEYEQYTFELTPFMSYTPDFKINDCYFEIKGRYTDLCMEKLSLFQEKFPHILLIIIDVRGYNELRNLYKKKINWEGK